MKSTKSTVETEVTPSKKKLTQARLPFKLLSEVPPSSPTSQPRKRKLSSETEGVSKIGKLSKENDELDESIVLSDDDGIDVCKPIENGKSYNPLAKMVGQALSKKKHLKSKAKSNKNKSKGKFKKSESEPSCSNKTESHLLNDEEMDVEINTSNSKKHEDKEVVIAGSHMDIKEKVIELEDSNDSCDIKTTKKETTICNVEVGEIEITPAPESFDVVEEMQNTTEIKMDIPVISNDEKVTKGFEKNDFQEKFTPKRKSRKDQNGSPLEETDSNKSLSSNATTPKHNKSFSVNTQENDSLLDSSKLTPKQLQKKLEAAKKKEEREKERLEREQKKQQEKEEKAKQKHEKEEQRKKEKEAKEEKLRKEREEKEEQRRKEKEEREKQKELEKKQKEEKEEQKRKEREEKEDQKRKEKEAKEEEKRKKQEALELEKQELELKKKKAAEAFVNFFVPKRKYHKDTVITLPSKSSLLSSFTIKAEMRLAPTVRVDLSEEKKEALVSFIQRQTSNVSELYLKSLKNGHVPKSSGKTWPLEENDDDVIIVEDDLPQLEGTGEIITCEATIREKLRPKLLSFHENRRPPYWGTWRKKSPFVKPRRPFGQDEKFFNYEVDSDDEWEEEQEGESIDGSVCGSEEDNAPDEYEVDNEVFVPHGYLSDEEGTMDDDDIKTLSPEAQKEKLKYLEDEFELELKKPTEKLKPRLFGLIWETQEGGKPDNCVDALWNYFGKITMIMNDPTDLLKPSPETEKEQEKKKVKKKKAPIEEEQNQTASSKIPKTPKSEKKKKSKAEEKDAKKADTKKTTPEVKKQPGINVFLNKINT